MPIIIITITCIILADSPKKSQGLHLKTIHSLTVINLNTMLQTV